MKQPVGNVAARLALVIIFVLALLAPPGLLTAAGRVRAQSPADPGAPQPQTAPGRQMPPAQAPLVRIAEGHGAELGQRAVSPRPNQAAAPPVAPEDNLAAAPALWQERYPLDQPQAADDLPNLFPYQPLGWDGPVVLSEYRGTTYNSDLNEGSTVYLDWAAANAGGDVSGSFQVHLYLDSSLIQSWLVSDLPGGYYTPVYDWILAASPSGGWHTVTLWVDPYGNIAESNETDNLWSADFYWYPLGGGDVNLTPYTPGGWSDPLMLSSQLDAQSSGDLYYQETVYVNWAVLNEGNADIPQAFSVGLFIDGSYVASWSTTGLPSYYYLYAINQVLGQDPLPGWHYVEIEADLYNQIAETDESDNGWGDWFYWRDPGSLPNLLPYTPDGWDNPVVAASEAGDDGDRRLYNDRPTYFDVAFANLGYGDAPQFDSCLYIDGALRHCWTTDLPSYYYYPSVDEYTATVTAGWHTIRLVVDANHEVTEFNENDNVWEADFYWEASSLPNLHPYRPDGWDDAIVPSSVAGTHVNDTLIANATTYIDWALINDGWGDIGATSFSVGLYLDGAALNVWSWAGGLPSGWFLYLEDYQRTIPLGWHTLELRADIYNQVAEVDESDNTLAVRFYWNAGTSQPDIRIEPTSVYIELSEPDLAAMQPVTLQREVERLLPFDAEKYGTGAVFASPTRYIYPEPPLAPLAPEDLPPRLDLSYGLPPIGNQGRAGSCVGWSTGYYTKGFQEGVDQGWSLTDPAHQFSVNYIWNQRQLQPGVCAGIYINAAMDLVVNQGDTPYNLFPYSENCLTQPTQAMRDAAYPYRAENFGAFFEGGQTATDAHVTQIKQWLVGGNPAVIGIPVMPEFDDPSGPYCLVDLPNRGASRGGHAIAVVGYDDNIGGTGKGGFKIVNSWGTQYGCNGFAYLTYAWFKQFTQEAYWMRDIRTGGNATRDFTIFNDGTSTLVIDKISKRGSSLWLELALPEALPMHLEPGQSATIELAINAAGLGIGTYTEVVEVTSNDPDEALMAVDVTLQTGVVAGAPANPPTNPSPANYAVSQPVTGVVLSWTATDPDPGDVLTFDVRFAESDPPSAIVCNDRTSPSCAVSNLKPNTTYYWRVVIWDGPNMTLGPIWQFTTTVLDHLIYLPLLRK